MSLKKAPLLSLKQVYKSYQEGQKKRHILENLSLDIPKGQVSAIIGQSGCGKSTLLNIISGIDSIDQGEINFDGCHLESLSEKERTLFRRQHIGFVFQFFNLIPYLSAWDNVLLSLEMNNLKNKDNIHKAKQLLEQLGMSDRIFDSPETLSGGERQRIAIVRALVHSPKLLLADEPTGNLDAKTSQSVMELFSKLIRHENKSALIVTHSPEVAKYCDNVFEMQSGVLKELSL